MDEGMFGAGVTGNTTTWWLEYGGEAKALQDVALRCAAPATAAGGERVFSALGNQWTSKRGSMLMGRAVMLTYIYFNGRAMDRLGAGPPADAWDEFFAFLESEEEGAGGEAAEPGAEVVIVEEEEEEEGAEDEQEATAGEETGGEDAMATQES